MYPLWNAGFRPFFLFGAAWSALQIFVWVVFQIGWLHSLPYSDPLVWHAHEMIFGYASAIIAGFILTASPNWTGMPGIQRRPLIGLVLLWTLARFLSVDWSETKIVFAIVDLAFFPALALSLKPYLWQKSQAHNKVFFLMFFVLFVLNLLLHLHVLGKILLPARTIVLGSVYLVILMIALVGGRVIPFFASIAVPEAKPIHLPWTDYLCHLSLALFVLVGTLWESSGLAAGLAFFAAALQGLRWALWRPWRSIHVPILFILYFAYAWIPIGLFLRSMASLGFIAPSVATHAFTAGAIGTMIYGMTTRVALGHTGRAVTASRAVVFGYYLISLSAILRVFGPLAYPSYTLVAIELSGSFWIFAHAVFLFVYGPILCRARSDGKAG